MATLERSCTVKMAVDQAETCWNDFVGQQQQAGGQPTAGNGSGQTAPDSGQNPGTVYFNDKGNGQTEVTMQLDPTGVSSDDPKTLEGRVDGYLQRFKQFVETR
jgi:hypothetical protein